MADCYLNGFDKTFTTNHSMATRKGLHCSFGTDADHTLEGEEEKEQEKEIWVNQVRINQ